MRKTISKTIFGLFLMILIACIANTAFAWPQLSVTMPSNVMEDQQFTIAYTANGNGERLMQVKVKDLGAGTDIVHGGLFTYEYSGIEIYAKPIGTYSFQLEVLDEKGASYTDLETVNVLGDTFAPGTVQNIHSSAKTNESITWQWLNPLDADFKEAIIFLNGVNVLNTTLITYTATGLTELTDYTISIQTIDQKGNINTTVVQDIQKTNPNVDITPPQPATNLVASSKSQNNIMWEWVNPTDPDLNHVNVYINNVNVANVTTYFYNATGLSAGTSYKIGIKTVDNAGNINPATVENTTLTLANPDTSAPAAVTNLNATQILLDRITWSWINPTNPDFNHAIIFIDNVNVANSTSTTYTATGFTANTQHKIGIQTVDNVGNANTSTVENTATTLSQTTPNFSVNNIIFTGKVSASVSATLTITNTGTQDLSTVEVIRDIQSRYGATISNAGAVAVGSSRNITVTITIPANETMGTKDIGRINITSAGIFKQANARLTVEGALSIDNVDIVGVSGVSSKKDIQDETNYTLEVKPESSFKIDVTIKNTNSNEKINNIVVEGVLQNIDNGNDIKVTSDQFDLNDGNDKEITLKFDVPLELKQDETYKLTLTAEGEDESGKANTDEFEFKVVVSKASSDIRISSTSFTKNNAQCIDSTILTVNAINAGIKKQDNVVIQATNPLLGLTLEKTVSFTDDENFEQSVDFPITIPDSLKNKAQSFNIALKILKSGTLYDTGEAVLKINECTLLPTTQAQEQTPQDDVTVQFLSAQSASGDKGLVVDEKKTGIEKTLDDVISKLNLGNDTLVIGGISFGVLLIGSIVGLIIYKRSTEILF